MKKKLTKRAANKKAVKKPLSHRQKKNAAKTPPVLESEASQTQDEDGLGGTSTEQPAPDAETAAA